MEIRKLLIIGGEGNGSIVAACVEDMRKQGDMRYQVAGFLNDAVAKGTMIDGFPVVGNTSEVLRFVEEGYFFSYAILMIGKGPVREKVFRSLHIPRERLAIIVHSSAFVGHNATLEPGVFVMAHSYIGPGAVIGECCTLKAHASVSHHVKLGALTHVSVGAIVGAYVEVGKAADISMGARVLEKRNVGDFAVVGASALVTNNVPEGDVVAGVPAHRLRSIFDL